MVARQKKCDAKQNRDTAKQSYDDRKQSDDARKQSDDARNGPSIYEDNKRRIDDAKKSSYVRREKRRYADKMRNVYADRKKRKNGKKSKSTNPLKQLSWLLISSMVVPVNPTAIEATKIANAGRRMITSLTKEMARKRGNRSNSFTSNEQRSPQQVSTSQQRPAFLKHQH